jgi:hypothetical protein
MKMEHTECYETSAYKIQTPGIYTEENTQQTRCFHGDVLDDSVLLRYDAVSLGKRFPAFRKNLLPSS